MSPPMKSSGMNRSRDTASLLDEGARYLWYYLLIVNIHAYNNNLMQLQ